MTSVMKTWRGKGATHTHNDVNKFYLPTFGDSSNCHAHGSSLSQKHSSPWISLSHLPLGPIANIQVKYAWEAELQLLVTCLKILSSLGSKLIKACQGACPWEVPQ